MFQNGTYFRTAHNANLKHVSEWQMFQNGKLHVHVCMLSSVVLLIFTSHTRDVIRVTYLHAYLEGLEQEAIATAHMECRPKLWLRCVDDVLGEVTNKAVPQLTEHINQVDMIIRFNEIYL